MREERDRRRRGQRKWGMEGRKRGGGGEGRGGERMGVGEGGG